MTTNARNIEALQILLIEDNTDHAALLARYIERFKGCAAAVTKASSLSEANRHLVECHFDLVLLDLHLPDADASRTLNELPRMATDTAVIILTAEGDLEVALQAVKKGAQDFIVKTDMTPDLMERAIRYAVQRKASEIALKELNDSLEQRVAKRTATLNLLHDVASVANRGDDIEEALRHVLERIVQEPVWCFGQVFVPSTADDSLMTAGIEATHHSGSFAPIREGTLGTRLPLAAHLTERAAATGQGQCVGDLLQACEPDVREAAEVLKIRGVVAFPIVVKAETEAVLELFSTEPIEDPETVLDCMSQMASHLGRVVERRQANRTLRASEERFRLLVNAVEDYAIIMLDTTGHVVSWNAGARRITGRRSREALGRHFACFYTEEDVAAGLPTLHLAIAARRGRIAIEAQRVRSNGERFPAEVVITALRDEAGELQGFAKVTHDATQRKRFEREIADATAAEQQRIGQDLHDGLGQELTGLTYQAERLRRQLERTSSPHLETVATLVDGIREALSQVRMLSKGLVPVEVDAHGLEASLEELTEHVQEMHGVTCRFVCQEPVPVDDNHTATQLYRIVQESLTNAVRHAMPTRINVELSASKTELRITVTDNGRGFDTTEPLSGSGMRIMRYRAGLINAHLQLESTPGAGTSVVCRLKVRKNETRPDDTKSNANMLQSS
ncbi:MAG: PAS domain S-box protein [Pirellulaceae bacterium]